MNNQVLIIESRNLDDISKNIHEGHTLQEILRMQGVSSVYYEVTTQEYLEYALSLAADDSFKYIHISAHGCKKGFELTNGDFISWDCFDSIAWPHIKNKCLVFSSCDVAKGVHEVFSKHKTLCNAVVAPSRKISWSEGVVAYSVFYYLATKPESGTKYDLKLMNSITEPGTFKLIKADTAVDKKIFALD